LVFSRDLAYPKANETERISKAYYRPGDYVFHQGDPGVNFYIIESGEVEIFRSRREGEPGEVIAVLGPGDFFGEMALVDNKPRNASVRARTPVEVVVMGKNVFTQISSSLGPLRDLISEAVRERGARQ
jgi:NADH dehydrogenase